MTDENERFSRRHGFEPQDREIRIRNEAPHDLRQAIVQIAYEAGAEPADLRVVICRVLRKLPEPNNWSPGNVAEEVAGLIARCEWFEVYDIAEAIAQDLRRIDERRGDRDKEPAAEHFGRELNRYFRKEGIGWQLVDGEIRVRGPEAFEEAVNKASQTLAATGRPTAAQEIHQALQDLSRRPEPDLTGAVQHGMAALECVAREATGDAKATLGEILKRNPDLLPKPLDQSVEKAWGYASEMGRHVREGRTPGVEEAELIVRTCASVSDCLVKKLGVKKRQDI